MTDFWMKLPFLLNCELMERGEEGCDISSFKERVSACNDQTLLNEMVALFDELSHLQPQPGFPFEEPSDLEGIKQAHPKFQPPLIQKKSDEELKDKFTGAWLGRCAGCTLGKPVEGIPCDQIEGYLRAAQVYPLTDYVTLNNASHPSRIRFTAQLWVLMVQRFPISLYAPGRPIR
jgi:hypothetical protein